MEQKSIGVSMKVGDLVRDIHGAGVLIITSEETNGYHDVYSLRSKVYWHVPKEHLVEI